MPTVVTGAQEGASVNEIIQVMADNWGYREDNNRFKNLIKRRINQTIREICNREPRMRVFRVFDAVATLKSGVGTYDVRETVQNGGFGWDGCTLVEQLIFNVIDNRPLERLEPEQFRERADLLETDGPPESWVSIKPWVVKIFPKPDADIVGAGDYWTELASLSEGTDVLDWPRSLDEVVMAGVDRLTAMVRLRERPQAIIPFERRFKDGLQDLTINEKVKTSRPQQGIIIRHLRSRRTIPSDNATDTRYWR